jgi:hypothetical protein
MFVILLVDLFVDLFVDWLVGWLVGLLVGWLVGFCVSKIEDFFLGFQRGLPLGLVGFFSVVQRSVKKKP